MRGYWNRPDETAKVMTADGFFRTGDIAVMQPDGQFRIVDRMKDMVLVSGFNVYPNEVEDVLARHPGVLEVAVIGLPDERSGEVVAAYVVRQGPGPDRARRCASSAARNLTRLQGAAPDRVPRGAAQDQCRQGAAPGPARGSAGEIVPGSCRELRQTNGRIRGGGSGRRSSRPAVMRRQAGRRFFVRSGGLGHVRRRN